MVRGTFSPARAWRLAVGPASTRTLGRTKTLPRVAHTKSESPKMAARRIFSTPFAAVYPMYVRKVERKGRTKEEVDEVICWLTGYDLPALRRQIEEKTDFEAFFAKAPAIHQNSSLIKGVVCGVRVEEVKDPLMKKIRLLEKLVDEIAKGKAMDKILRS